MRLKHELFEQRNQGESTINVIGQRIPQKLNEKKAFKSVETGKKFPSTSFYEKISYKYRKLLMHKNLKNTKSMRMLCNLCYLKSTEDNDVETKYI